MPASSLSNNAMQPGGPLRTLRLLSVLGFLAAFLLLTACGGYKDDIAAVQAAEGMTGKTNAELVEQIAGARGTVEWRAEPGFHVQTEVVNIEQCFAKFADTFSLEGKDNVILVEARIEKVDKEGIDHLIRLQWVHNRQSGRVAEEDVIIDGRSRGLLQGAMDLLLLEFE